MLTEEEQLLRHKAENAILNYRRIYDTYPAMVGFEHNRLRSFQTAHLSFPQVYRRLPTAFETADDLSLISMSLEIVHFHPVRGKKIRPDEVYLPHPKDNRKAASGAAIARLLRMVEGRYKREFMRIPDEIRRDFLETQYQREYCAAFLGEECKPPLERLMDIKAEVKEKLTPVYQKLGWDLPSYLD